MNFKTLVMIKAVVCLAFGPVLLLAPGPLLNLLGLSFGSGAALTAREYGAAVLGNLMLTWFARNAEASVARRAIVIHLFVYDAIGLCVSLAIQLSGDMNQLGWGIVAVYAFFTAAFGHLLFRKTKA